jgi:transposase-like protein/transposase InsO family protein
MKHKTQDYKISAVKYYLQNDVSLDEVCDIFVCKKSSLRRWIMKYKAYKHIERLNRSSKSYKITKDQVKYAIRLLKQNEQITMTELKKLILDKYPSFDITSQHLGKVLRDNNKTRKRTKHQHFPVTRYGVEVNKENELNKFYNEVSKYPIDKIICLDETSIQPAMMLEYSRCQLGHKCVVNTDDNYVFKKFTLLVAINNSGCVGSKLYQQGGMTKERFVDFLEEHIFSKYKDNLIILDNAGSHNNQFVKDAILNSGNKYLFSIPYTPTTNAPIENYFNQIKHYLKLNKKVLKYNELNEEIKNAIKMVRKENYKNYFNNAYNKEGLRQYTRKLSTRYRKPKTYKTT